MSNLTFEIAKDGNWTVKNNVTNKYFYSKYNPKKVSVNFMEQASKEYILVLGVGLGYELEMIRTQTNKQIVAIEVEEGIKDFVTPIENCEIFFLNELPDDFEIVGSPQVILNGGFFELHKELYLSILKKVTYKKTQEVIWVVKEFFIMEAVAQTFEKLGYAVEYIEANDILQKIIDTKKIPDYVVSSNYLLELAKLLKKFEVKYIAWNLDSPWAEMFMPNALDYDNAVIFDFDRGMVEKVRKELGKEIHYLPLAGKIDYIESVSVNESKDYACDISFIGHSTINNHLMANIATNIPERLLERLMEHALLQKNKPAYILEQLVTESLYEEVFRHDKVDRWNEKIKHFKNTDALAYDISKLTSHKERVELVDFLSKYNGFNLYGDENWNFFIKNKSCYKGGADYDYELYQIIKASKININDTRPYFRDAIPLRVFEILSCEGFCLTNYKEHETQIFENNKHLVMYRDLQDLGEIVDYYLAHPNERERIQKDGYDHLMKYHTLEIRLLQMMEIAKEVFYSRELTKVQII